MIILKSEWSGDRPTMENTSKLPTGKQGRRSQVNRDNSIGEEIRRRVTPGNRSYDSLQKLFRLKTLNRNLNSVTCTERQYDKL